MRHTYHTLLKNLSPYSKLGLAFAASFVVLMLLIFATSFGCAQGLIFCNRWMFLLASPVYILTTVIFAKTFALQLPASFIAASMVYTTLCYKAGKNLEEQRPHGYKFWFFKK